MTTKCFALVNGRRMRLTKLDRCGRLSTDPCSSVVSDGFVTATISGEIDEGEEIEQKNAAGEVCVSRPPCPTKKWNTAEIEFCKVDPALFQLINPKWKLLHNAAGDVVGIAMGKEFTCDAGFALEIWTDVEGDDICDNPDAEGAWGYFLLPWMSNGYLSGDVAVANATINFTFNAKTKTKSKWGAGPYDVMLDAGGQPAPLFEPVESWEDTRIMVVDVEPPQAGCGCYIAATGATSGTPGAFTPTDAWAPEDIDDLRDSAVTASPATAWTAGSYVELDDGSRAHWDGDTWEPGTAP